MEKFPVVRNGYREARLGRLCNYYILLILHKIGLSTGCSSTGAEHLGLVTDFCRFPFAFLELCLKDSQQHFLW